VFRDAPLEAAGALFVAVVVVVVVMPVRDAGVAS